MLGELGGLREIRSGNKDQELLAAETVGEIERAQLLAQQIGDLLQDGVADAVAARIVDLLEVIQIGRRSRRRTRR